MAQLQEIQARIAETRRQRGFTTDPVQIFTLLTEEVGEVAAELKKTWSPNYADLNADELADELSDVFVLLTALATSFDIDLESAVENKFIEADGARTWATALPAPAPEPPSLSVPEQSGESFPTLVAVCLDATDARELAEFYRGLLGYVYRAGDEPPADADSAAGDNPDWLVLLDRHGVPKLGVQKVEKLPAVTWPEPKVPQQLHLDLSVGSTDELARHHERALALGARLLEDRSEDPAESINVYADPAGHPFCILVSPPSAAADPADPAYS